MSALKSNDVGTSMPGAIAVFSSDTRFTPSPQHAAAVSCSLPMNVSEVLALTYEINGLDELSAGEHRQQAVP